MSILRVTSSYSYTSIYRETIRATCYRDGTDGMMFGSRGIHSDYNIHKVIRGRRVVYGNTWMGGDASSLASKVARHFFFQLMHGLTGMSLRCKQG